MVDDHRQQRMSAEGALEQIGNTNIYWNNHLQHLGPHIYVFYEYYSDLPR